MKRTVLIPLLSIFWTLGLMSLLAAAPVPSDMQGAAAAQAAPGGADSVKSVPVAPAASAADNAVSTAEGEPAPMTLEECMRYAVEHSPAVRRQAYTNRNYRQNYIESVAALVPSVSGTVGASTSFGRSVDPETNTYTDVSNFDNSYSLSGQLPLFAGLTGINTVRAARVMRLQGVEELQLARDEIALKTMQAYFDVVYYTESVRLAREIGRAHV